MTGRNATYVELRTNPEESYDTPDQLALDGALSVKEKLEALSRWEMSVQDRLAASNEGMPTNNTTDRDLEMLSLIEKARHRVEADQR